MQNNRHHFRLSETQNAVFAAGGSESDSPIRQKMNVMIIAIRKSGGGMAFNPSSQTRIETGDTLIALGHPDDLNRLEKILIGR